MQVKQDKATHYAQIREPAAIQLKTRMVTATVTGTVTEMVNVAVTVLATDAADKPAFF
jgi:hypothetical protein